MGRMRYLILCHIEKQFEWAFDPDYLIRVENAAQHYDRVIALYMECPHVCVRTFADEQWLWLPDFGDMPDEYECEHVNVPGGGEDGEDVTDIIPQFYSLYGHDIDIAGGFEGMCLWYLKVALDHLGIEYGVRQELVYYDDLARYHQLVQNQ